MFQPAKLGRLTVPNRFMRSATWEALSDLKGNPKDSLFTLLENLAFGNVGLVVPGAAYVTKSGQMVPNQTGLCTIEQARIWHRGIANIHKHEAKVIFQLAHGGLFSSTELNGGAEPCGPTAFNKNQHELTNTEIEDLIEKFAHSANLAHLTEADGVQLHAAHDFLLSEFLSPAFNHRTDKWGGSVEKRVRILQEIITTIRQRVPDSFSISLKINGNDHRKSGITPQLAAKYVGLLKKDIDFFEISAGNGFAVLSTLHKEVLTRNVIQSQKQKLIDKAQKIFEGRPYKDMYNLDALNIIRKLQPDAKLALVGGNRSFSSMKKIIESGKANLISMSRPLLNDPYLIHRFKVKTLDKALCINCGSCLLNSEKGVFCHLKPTSYSPMGH